MGVGASHFGTIWTITKPIFKALCVADAIWIQIREIAFFFFKREREKNEVEKRSECQEPVAARSSTKLQAVTQRSSNSCFPLIN